MAELLLILCTGLLFIIAFLLYLIFVALETIVTLLRALMARKTGEPTP